VVSLADVVQLPFFEAAATQCLRTDAVRYCASALAVPTPDASKPEIHRVDP
jgi:hypothetical protein